MRSIDGCTSRDVCIDHIFVTMHVADSRSRVVDGATNERSRKKQLPHAPAFRLISKPKRFSFDSPRSPGCGKLPLLLFQRSECSIQNTLLFKSKRINLAEVFGRGANSLCVEEVLDFICGGRIELGVLATQMP